MVDLNEDGGEGSVEGESKMYEGGVSTMDSLGEEGWELAMTYFKTIFETFP